MPGEDDLRLGGMHNLPGLLVQFLEKGLGDPTGPLRAAARNGRVLAAPRLEDDERFDEDWQNVARESGALALLAVPVEAPRTDECALVLVFFAEERRFADDDLELARNLAGAARARRAKRAVRSRAAGPRLAQKPAHRPPAGHRARPGRRARGGRPPGPTLLDDAAVSPAPGDEPDAAAGMGEEAQDARLVRRLDRTPRR